jgi:hypothetical protein
MPDRPRAPILNMMDLNNVLESVRVMCICLTFT